MGAGSPVPMDREGNYVCRPKRSLKKLRSSGLAHANPAILKKGTSLPRRRFEQVEKAEMRRAEDRLHPGGAGPGRSLHQPLAVYSRAVSRREIEFRRFWPTGRGGETAAGRKLREARIFWIGRQHQLSLVSGRPPDRSMGSPGPSGSRRRDPSCWTESNTLKLVASGPRDVPLKGPFRKRASGPEGSGSRPERLDRTGASSTRRKKAEASCHPVSHQSEER